MRTLSLLALGTAALAMFSSLPVGCAAHDKRAVAIEKRDVSIEAQAILGDARLRIASVKLQLHPLLTEHNLVNQVFVTLNVLPLVASINVITADAAQKITALQVSASVSKKRQVNTDAVAQAVVDLIEEVYETLEPLIGFLGSIPLLANLLGGLLASLDGNLVTIAEGLGILLAGVLELVRDLLQSLTLGLSGLGFINFLKLLNIIPA